MEKELNSLRSEKKEGEEEVSVSDNYEKIVRENLEKLYADPPAHLAEALSAEREGSAFLFDAFGEACRIAPEGITLGGSPQTGVPGILISLYALHAKPLPPVLEPLKAYKEFPDTMPYAGAFATHTEGILVPHVERIREASGRITGALDGGPAPEGASGDFAFLVRPLPKIALCYIFYLADDDFPASVTCLFSNNADAFAPKDALADVGEYTSRKIIRILDEGPKA